MSSARWLSVGLWIALGVFAVLTALVFVDDRWRHFVDSAIYILTARSLDAGEGYTYLGRPFFVRPPGLSLLLAPLVGDAPDWRLLNGLVQAAAAGAFVVIGLALRRLQGAVAGGVAALAFAVSPLTVDSFNTVLSEFPYLVLFFSGAWLLLPARDGRPPGWPAALAGAVLLAASVWFRTVGLLVLPGLALAAVGWNRDTRRKALAAGALVLLASVPWFVWTASARAEAERPSTQLLMFDYTTALLRIDPRDPDSAWVDADGWVDRIAANTRALGRGVGHALTGADLRTDEGPLSLGVALIVIAAVLFTALTRRSLLDGYALAYLVLLLTYFTWVDRLLMPVLPLVLSAIVHATWRLLSALGRRPGLADVPAPAASVLVLAVLAASLASLPAALEHTPQRKQLDRMDRVAARWLQENAPPGARILNERGSVLTLLSGRTAYTWRNLPGPWPEGCPEVDFAVFTPRSFDASVAEDPVAAAALERIDVPVQWLGKPDVMRVYRLRDLDGR